MSSRLRLVLQSPSLYSWLEVPFSVLIHFLFVCPFFLRWPFSSLILFTRSWCLRYRKSLSMDTGLGTGFSLEQQRMNSSHDDCKERDVTNLLPFRVLLQQSKRLRLLFVVTPDFQVSFEVNNSSCQNSLFSFLLVGSPMDSSMPDLAWITCESIVKEVEETTTSCVWPVTQSFQNERSREEIAKGIPARFVILNFEVCLSYYVYDCIWCWDTCTFLLCLKKHTREQSTGRDLCL